MTTSLKRGIGKQTEPGDEKSTTSSRLLSRWQKNTKPQKRPDALNFITRSSAVENKPRYQKRRTTMTRNRILYFDLEISILARVKPGLVKKLVHRWHGPFRVKRKVEGFAYELDLPDKSG
ncbi:LOW QUALITY PROTEIN: hypothetical protein PHMEG_0004807 [Phytophthora megakarya]|uniref:Reverse transcriptase n=1 Tax=Phytophthora megakarya TaxID=4795 RepID=A0A225WT41_9STRA|nr:LOW QUALITY PROTEIN: hypothetical protein PHMEG_0004807 [Phytophthora megakarya]